MKVRLGLRIKLIGIINIVLLSAALLIVVSATNLFSEDNTARIQESNLDSAGLIAQEMRNDLNNLTEKMRLLGVSLMQSLSPSQSEAFEKPFFERENDLLAATVLTPTQIVGRASNDAQLKAIDVSMDDILALQNLVPREKLFSGVENIQSGELHGTIPVLTISIPLVRDDNGKITHVVIATLKQDRLLKAVQGNTIITSYLVDQSGNILAHPDQQKVLRHENMTHLEIVKQLLAGKTNNGQTRFIDPETQTAYLGAFKTVGFAGIGVISQVEEAKALEPARRVKRSSTLITGMVAVVGFLIVFFFSLSITRPLWRLVDATGQVARGNYQIKLKKAPNDEIGDLTTSFTNMASGLAEREKIKSAFSKFHSKEIADKILSGELVLTGERKKVTIFFSDIRSFTSISENLSPEEVVDLINGYMTRMVKVIFEHGGVVDKYVGDAIMAVYGTPVSHGDDALRAVSAALRMREELKSFNTDQAQKGKSVIAIGMGMNTGDVVAGNIGSPERMEYTILGDNVNLASRMESQTKEFKTDILISASTYEEIKDKIECVARGSTHVKGKAQEVAVYEVIQFKPGCEYIPAAPKPMGENTVINLANYKQPPPFKKDISRKIAA